MGTVVRTVAPTPARRAGRPARRTGGDDPSPLAGRRVPRRRDVAPHRADEPLLRHPRRPRGQGRGRERDAPDRVQDARCREARHSRRHPAQARRALTQRVRGHHGARGDRLPDPEGLHVRAGQYRRDARLDASREGRRHRYPRGLRGDEIPLEGRIAAIADVFDALTTDRVYRAALPLSQAISIMRDGRGTHFDGELLDLFLASVPREIRPRRRPAAPSAGA